MTTLTFDEARLSPLVTDDDILERIASLIGRANVRQLWLVFLDADDVQLPVLVPIADVPPRPSEPGVAMVVAGIGETMRAIGAARLVTVWERYGSDRLTPVDAEWARSLHDECASSGVDLRAMLLSHRTGVRLIDEHDYAFIV